MSTAGRPSTGVGGGERDDRACASVTLVEAAEIVRTARRRAGLSQRAMATASGIGTTTLAAVEAGRRTPSLLMLNAVLAAAGMELAVDRPVQPPCRHMLQHLQDSLTVRLHRWLGGNGHPGRGRALPLWCELRDLAATGRVELPGRAALGLWLPGIARSGACRSPPPWHSTPAAARSGQPCAAWLASCTTRDRWTGPGAVRPAIGTRRTNARRRRCGTPSAGSSSTCLLLMTGAPGA